MLKWVTVSVKDKDGKTLQFQLMGEAEISVDHSVSKDSLHFTFEANELRMVGIDYDTLDFMNKHL